MPYFINSCERRIFANLSNFTFIFSRIEHHNFSRLFISITCILKFLTYFKMKNMKYLDVFILQLKDNDLIYI